MIISQELKNELDVMITTKPVNLWTKEKEDILKYLYGKASRYDILKILQKKYPEDDITMSAIDNKISRLQLPKQRSKA